MKEWQVMITEDIATARSLVYIFREVSLDQVQVYHPQIVNNEIQWQVGTYETGELLQPTLVLGRLFRGVAAEFASALAKHFGVELPEVEVAKSAFEAQSRHLEDLQKMLFGFDFVTLERGKPIVEERIVEVERPRNNIE